MANKVVWPTVRRLRGKRSQGAFVIDGLNGVTLKDQDAILNRWRKYFSDVQTQLMLYTDSNWSRAVRESIDSN